MASSTNTPSPNQSKNTEYQALYDRNESSFQTFQDHYIIAFKPGHSLAKHFAFLGKEIKIEGTLNEGYLAKLDHELFETVRRDPGVEMIEDDTLGEWHGPSEEELEQARREEADKERARKAE